MVQDHKVFMLNAHKVLNHKSKSKSPTNTQCLNANIALLKTTENSYNKWRNTFQLPCMVCLPSCTVLFGMCCNHIVNTHDKKGNSLKVFQQFKKATYFLKIWTYTCLTQSSWLISNHFLSIKITRIKPYILNTTKMETVKQKVRKPKVGLYHPYKD